MTSWTRFLVILFSPISPIIPSSLSLSNSLSFSIMLATMAMQYPLMMLPSGQVSVLAQLLIALIV
ncbi:hypothetical protein AZE42_14005 [Rhizopogon vesiculosus]|uniref:Flagellar biosynthetic protein FliP n=1 Tax=Rhizopogon vesiculosus TaxID=180088 RepID=A0A1J8QYS8_9AGAM|nr:hypothetical protein AZE42_14005 [Rhizopogon vesiculosus]